MVTTEILNPRSEVELEKSIKLELTWLSSTEADCCGIETIRQHLHKLRGLKEDLRVEKFVNAQLRRDAKGQPIVNPLARSWHK